MPNVLDREVRDQAEDAFGHRHYADALRSFIEDDQHVPPYTIGLLGTWGTGKSTIKQIYISELTKDISKRDGIERRRRVKTIEFNAWRHGSEDVKRALLRQVFLQLGGSEDQLHREFFCQIQRIAPERKPVKDFAFEVIEKWLVPLLALALVLTAVGAFAWWIVGFLGLTNWWATISIPGALAAAAWLLRDVFNFKLQPLSRYTPVTVVQAPSATAEQYETLLLSQIRAFKQTRDGRDCSRLVVFVDDLDRLSALEMVTGLDAIRTFMDIPEHQLPEDRGIVFVISCDEERVAEALSRRDAGPEVPGAILDLAGARRFLDRIFQFRLEIPPVPRRDMRAFAAKQLERFPDVVSELEAINVKVNQIIEPMMHVGVKSPRNALQIVNAFLQSWWLANKREAAGKASDQAGGLRAGAVTGNPISLAALSALKVDFPDFYKRLQAVPELLPAFQRLVFGGGRVSDEPVAIREVVAEFLTVTEDKATAKDRDLRRFMASIRDVRWPKSLRPLLLLTEDALSRKLGDRAVGVRDSLVSGDVEGVLEALGRVEDSKPLTVEDLDLLKGILDDLVTESDERRDNASLALADLLPRLDASDSLSLVTRLMRRLAESPTLRHRLGIERIKNVCERATQEDRRDLVSTLCLDVLKPQDSEWTFLTANGELPHLDDAAKAVDTVCNMAFEAWKNNQLLPHASAALVSWVKHRRVTVGSEQTDLPFSNLDDWYSRYEVLLTDVLGEEYVEQLLRHLESDSLDNLDVPEALRRVERIFQRMKALGTKTAARMWAMIGRLAAVRHEAAPEFAWTFLTAHCQEATVAQFSAIVAPLATRLDKEMQGNKEWSLDWEEGASSLLALCESRPDDLSAEALKALSELTNSLSQVDETTKFAVRGAELLSVKSPATISTALDSWANGIRNETHSSIAAWIAKRFASHLSDAQRDLVISQLNNYVNTDAVPDQEGQRLKLFAENLPEDAFQNARIQKFLRQLFPKIAERFNNAAYLNAVFPAVPLMLPHAPADQSGPLLTGLFGQAKTVPAVYGSLHKEMAGHWPTPKDGSYDPANIFTEAAAFAQSHANQPDAASVVVSMASMIHANLLSPNHESTLVAAACSLWPHAAETVAAIMLDSKVAPAPSEIAGLIESIDPNSEEDVERLAGVWTHFAALIDASASTDVCLQLLEQDQIELPIGKKDGAIQLWYEAVEEYREPILIQAANTPDLNDSQRHRLWLEIEARAGDLSLSLFNEVVPSMLIREDCPDTVAAILRWQEPSGKRFKKKGDQSAFCQALAPAYFDTPSADTRSGIAKWIHQFNGTSAIEEALADREMNVDALGTLKAHFPTLHV